MQFVLRHRQLNAHRYATFGKSTVPENLKSLTSLRFFAALSIFWLHTKLYFDWAKIGPSGSWNHSVSFFFVLSGFILTHAHSDGIRNYLHFIRGRFARLWPLHLACFFAVLVFVKSGSQTFDGPGVYGRWASAALNLLLLQSWMPALASVFSWNSVSWSISVEMFFYAMFPILLWLLARRPILFAAIWLLPLPAIWVALRWANVPPDGDVFSISGSALINYFPPSRLLEFGAGMVACKIWQRLRGTPIDVIQASVIEACAIGIAAVWFLWLHPLIAEPPHVSIVLSEWATCSGSFPIFAIVIPMIASGRGIIGQALAARPLVILGEASFALYMTHQIVMKVIVLSLPVLGSPLAVFGLCFAIAIAAHFLVERPARIWIMQALRG